MANSDWHPNGPWDDLLASLAPQAPHAETGILVTPVTHAFSADILLPRTGADGLSALLPATGHFKTLDGLRIACLTKHHYLLHGESEPDAKEIEALFGSEADLIDQSGARACLIVSGPALRDCLRRGIPIDLDPDILPSGSFAATYAGHIPVHVSVIDEARIELTCPLSMAGSFWHWLHETAQAFGIARR